jgi:MraZ protein
VGEKGILLPFEGETVFRGVAHLNLDSKGRLAVPSRFRDALQVRCAGHLVITADFDKCLLIYPLPDWEPIQQKLMSLSSLNPRIRDLQRRLIGYAEDIDMDAAGRVLISSALREFAALGKSVVLVGQGNKFELWDKEKWEQALERGGGFGDGDLPPELEGFSL